MLKSYPTPGSPVRVESVLNRVFPAIPRKRGILVVDDSFAVREFLKRWLQSLGYVVWTSASGMNALCRYRSQSDAIDLVLIDIFMPDWDGPQTLAALRELNANLPVCFMSGHTGKYTETELLGLGANRVFTKPLLLRDISETFEQLLNGDRPSATEVCRWFDDGGHEIELRERVSSMVLAG